MRQGRLAVTVLIVVALAVAAQRLARRSAGAMVETADVTSGPIVREVLASGTLEPKRAVEVGAQVSGTIQSLEADFNSLIRAGQVIARIDPSPYRTRLIQAEGAVGQAHGELLKQKALADDARTTLERAEALAAQNFIPRTDLDSARVAMRQANAAVKGQIAAVAAAQADVTQARLALERTVIRAPIDGIVIGRHVEVGQTLASTFESPVLFTIADLGVMQLLVDVDESEIGGVEPGRRVAFRVEAAAGQTYEGTVAQVRLPATSDGQPVATTGTSAAASSPTPQSSGPSTSSQNTAGRSNQSGSSTPATPTSPSPPTAGSSAPSPSGSAPGAAAAPATNVLTYVAVIDVPNREGLLRPGSTAIVSLSTANRANVVRVPNTALAFRPSPDVVEAAGQRLEAIEPSVAKDAATSRSAVVWRFRNDRFEAVPVEVGIANETWTELVRGAIAPGERLVTAAAIRK